jgi:hypothetical protein
MTTEATSITVQSDQPLAITDASAPFNDPNADVILRSSDNIDFRGFKMFLSYASPVFKDIFTLPQVSTGDNRNEMRDGLPIIPVGEERKTLESLLLLCYPMTAVDHLASKTLEDMHGLLKATIKYEMENAKNIVRKWLIAPCFLKKDAVRAFAIACHYRLKEEARVAAKSMVGQPLGTYLPNELELITGRQPGELQRYRAKCIEAIKKLPDDRSWDFNSCQQPCSSSQNRRHRFDEGPAGHREWGMFEHPVLGMGHGDLLKSSMLEMVAAMSHQMWDETKIRSIMEEALTGEHRLSQLSSNDV